MKRQPTPEQVQKLVLDCKKLQQVLATFSSHEDALQALLTTYCAISSAHPCCVELHARLLLKAGEVLLAAKIQPAHSIH